MALTDEEYARIKEELFPDVQVISRENGRPKFAVVYDKDPTTQPPKLKFKLNKDAFDYFLLGIGALKDGLSYRQVADYIQANTGHDYSYESVRRLCNSLLKMFPEWKERRGKAHKSNTSSNIRHPDFKDKAKQKEAREKAILKRKITQLSGEYAAMKTKDMVEKGKLPEDALKNPTDYLDKTHTVVSPPLARAILAEKEARQVQDVIFKPNPGPQTAFLAATEREVLYGGSAGGGKSYALLADPVRYFSNKNFNGILLRRTNDELRELVWKTQELYPLIYKGAKWSERKSQWTFPSGARLWLTYLDREDDVLRYQGQAFTWIGFDELTQHPTPFAWNYMRSRLRTTDSSLPLCMRATTNPGGPGHGWVKKMFIDPAPANSRFCAKDSDTNEELRYPSSHARAGEPLFYRRFIPARLSDNPYLMSDGQYEANLLSLPENQRRQLLDGDWMVAEGAAFPEFSVRTHTCDPFEVPSSWRKFRSCDFGYSTFSAVHWFAIDPAFETLYVYRELYISKCTARELARKIMELEMGEDIAYGVLDSSTWHKRGHTGPSIAEEMIAEGCRWRPADRTGGSRVAGKNRLHELLKYDEATEQAGVIFFNTCRQIIADLQVIPSDPKGSDDIDVRYASDHTYDSIRYGIMSRPRSKSLFDFGENSHTTAWKPFDKVFGY
jgi:hypothetical protein